MSSNVHVVATIALVQNLAVPRHQDRDGVRGEQHPGGDAPDKPVGAGEANAEIFQIHRVHQVVKSYMRILSAQAGKKRRTEAGKGMQRVAAECAEEQIEPDHVRI